jgi:CDP-6-deoxy-D-xylo-4-hexulose-3-dehydrase
MENQLSSSVPITETELRTQIFTAVQKYCQFKCQPPQFIPGVTYIPASGKVIGHQEIQNMIDAALDGWLTTGRYAAEFEKRFADWMGVKHCTLVNSGSSADLLALTALTSPQLGYKRLQAGDEVITVASGFPSTINPIFQNQLVPVFLDVQLPTYNIDIAQLEEALSSRTRAVMIAHTLGNPFDLNAIMNFAQQHDLWVIEDNCDAVGSLYNGQKTGTFGHLATVSFYPAHHITMGEGGAVITNNGQLKRIVESFRDWGRDCHCDPGADNTCGKRFGWQLGELPFGYDHKYTYSHIGYNLKMTDMQAAAGCAQLDKLPEFVAKRQQNFQFLHEQLQDLQAVLILPEATPHSEPSWFGFPIAVRPDAPFTRHQVVQYLENHKIGTRLLFGGNLIRQPAYKEIFYKTIGSLPHSDFVMNQVFWIGVFPGLSKEMLSYVVEVFRKGIHNKFK